MIDIGVIKMDVNMLLMDLESGKAEITEGGQRRSGLTFKIKKLFEDHPDEIYTKDEIAEKVDGDKKSINALLYYLKNRKNIIDVVYINGIAEFGLMDTVGKVKETIVSS